MPDVVWDEIAAHGVDTVWFMGIWKRSAVAREMALDEPWLRESFPGVKDEDIIGSAYSIQEYVVDEAFGGDSGLAIARAKLKERGIGLILDYVPNHVGIDHSWVTNHPEYLIGGTQAELEAQPKAFIQTPGGIIARGKDPNFAPWSDVLQINAYSGELRQVVAQLLEHIATMCDGVRCDMAMLMMNDIFEKTWGGRAGTRPAEEYWPSIIAAVKAQNPEFIFLAEVYWGKEAKLLDQGFDFCYDKELYDELLNGTARTIHKHLQQPFKQQQRLMRFIENHDEARASAVFAGEKHQAAAVVSSTIPGIRLFHDGQFDGRCVRLPVYLGRRQNEVVNEAVRGFYKNLIHIMDTIDFKADTWQLLETRTGLFPHESSHILAWSWSSSQTEALVIVVNYSQDTASAKLPFLHGKKVVRVDDIANNPVEVLRHAIVTLAPWQVVFIRTAEI